MATKNTQENSEEYSTLQSSHQGNGCSTTDKASYVQTFNELPSISVEEQALSSSSGGTESIETSAQVSVEQTTRTTTQVSTSEGNAMVLIPRKDSALLLGHWISDDSESYDDKISSAMKNFKEAIKEVECAGKHLQKCVEAKDDEREREVEDSRREAKEYKEKCANASERERELRECYELEISLLESNVAKLQLKRKEDGAALQHLKQQHTEETEDLQHTIRLQAKHCREVELDLQQLRKRHAKKEQDVAKLRQKLEKKEKELEELGRTVKIKEGEFETIKENCRDEKLRSMILEKDEMTEKLRACKEISELVSRLPNITSQAERDKITKQVMKELGGISRTPSAKRAKSWR